MTATLVPRPAPAAARRPVAEEAGDSDPVGPPALAEWLVKRGVLFVLLLAPVGSLFVGLLRLVPTRVGYLWLVVASPAAAVWVAWRRRVSNDPTEPAHHLHRYALYALFPYVVFSVVRIPVFYLSGMVYWAPWQTFGFGATGNPVGFWPSLLAGASLYSLQGLSLSLGFYTLFRRHSVLNALLYYFVFISSLYSFVFPVLLLRGSKPGLPFHLTNYWAHLWMGLTAVAMPALLGRVWPRLRRPARTGTVVGLAAIWACPYAFAFTKAALWQFPTQARLERAAFAAVALEPAGPPAATVDGDTARYAVALRFGPREYVTYSHAHKAVGAEDVAVSGRLVRGGTPVAWCTGSADALPGLAKVRDPQKYFAALHRIDHTAIPLGCAGPAAALVPGAAVTFEYAATLTLTGERTRAERSFSGAADTVLPAPEPAPSTTSTGS